MNEINYDEKIKTFQLITENCDYEIAFNYLTKYNWDEHKACQFYNKDINNFSDVQANQIHHEPHYTHNLHDENDRSKEVKENLLQQYNSNIKSSTVIDNRQSISTWQSLMKTIKSFVFCTKSNNDDVEITKTFLNYVPGKIDQFDIFVNNLRSKIGILILFQYKETTFLEEFFSNLKKNDYLCDILRENYILFCLDINSIDGKRISGLLNDQLLTPSFIFLFNTNQRNLNKNSILNKLEGEFSNTVFQDALIQNIDLVSSKKDNLITDNGFEDENSPAKMIKMQKEELKNLEEMEIDKKRKQIEEENNLKRENEEKLKKELEKEEKRKNVCKNLPKEPIGFTKLKLENDQNSTKIIFRYPDLNRRIERRFLKTDKVETLYNFVDSLGKEIFSESDNYQLVQTFPNKSFSDRERSLEDEGLFPNAIIQIREI